MDHDNVYPPLEDSMQTMRIINWLMGQLTGPVVIVDVGSGSGVLLRSALETISRDIWGLGVDISVAAAGATLIGLSRFSSKFDVVVGNVLDWIRDGFKPRIVVTNPPYLPGDWWEDPRVLGGPNGRLVIDAVIRWVASRGVPCLVITQSSLSDWEATVHFMGINGYLLIVMASSHYFFEDIITMVFMLRGTLNC